MSMHIGNYEVVAELGRGGMGVVYKAREESLQRFVAIKMLGNQLVENESVALRFMREARAVADLNHPNLVQVFRVDRHEDQPYFVMEYVEGESLKTLIQREDKMQPVRALQILKEVAAGLAAAHEKGVVHRDIKPENIMLTRYGGVKVVDFGIARVDEPGTRLTTTGIGLGTPSYLSPEVCLSQDVDQRSDIFSLGVVLFEMLTGDTPFKSDSPFELMTKVVEARVPDVKALNPNVDEGVKQVLAKMIAKRPKLRYQNCDELISDIEDYRAGRVPRWARNMPLETEPASSGDGAVEPDTATPTEGPAVLDSETSRATTPIPHARTEPPDQGPEPSRAVSSASTVALEDRTRASNTTRVALVALAVLLLAGGVAAASWYLIAGPERPLAAVFGSGSQPSRADKTGEPVTGAESGSATGSEKEASGASGAQASGTREDAPVLSDAADAADAAVDADATAAPAETRHTGARPAETGDSSTASAGGAMDGPVVAGSGTDSSEVSGAAKTDTAPDEISDEALASVASRSAARPDPSAGLPGRMPVVVVAVGDAAVAGIVAREMKQALGAASFEVMDEQLIDGLARAQSLAGVARAVSNADARVLVYADVVPTGERELRYYGRQGRQYLATLEVRVVELPARRAVGAPIAEPLEYVELNAARKARELAVPVARDVVARLRAMRPGRRGD